MSMLNVSVDIETLGTNPNAPVIAIGAVEFNPKKPYDLGQEFYATIDWDDAIKHGLVDGSTLEWWMSQDESAKQALKGERKLLHFALSMFRAFLRDCGMKDENFRLWVHGENFDEPVLRNAFRACGYERPWKYNCVRDNRTLYEVTGVWPVSTHYTYLIPHFALHDAKRQAYDIQRAFRYKTSDWVPQTEMLNNQHPDIVAGAIPVCDPPIRDIYHNPKPGDLECIEVTPGVAAAEVDIPF